MNLQSNIGIIGEFRVTKYKNGKAFVGDWQKNLVVSSSGVGRNIIVQHLTGTTSNPLEITQMTLSTNDTAPTVADTSLGGTEVNTPVQLLSISGSEANVINLSAFFTDNELPNNTYNKIGLKMGSILLTSALLVSTIEKDTGEEYRIDYRLSIS